MPDQAEAMKQLDTLSEALVQLMDDSQDYNSVVEREADSLEKLSQDMTKLREDYSQIVELVTVSKRLLKMSEVLTVQEQSLSMSWKLVWVLLIKMLSCWTLLQTTMLRMKTEIP